MNINHLNKVKRVLVGAAGLALMLMSATFSNDGFGFQIPNRSWMGWVMCLAIIVIQMVWSQDGVRGNLTLTAAVLFAYAYGIFTNIGGILVVQGLNPDTILTTNWTALFFPVICGVLLEFAPEPLVLWALTGTRVADVLGSLLLGSTPPGVTAGPTKAQAARSRNGHHAGQGQPMP